MVSIMLNGVLSPCRDDDGTDIFVHQVYKQEFILPNTCAETIHWAVVYSHTHAMHVQLCVNFQMMC